jgi:L-seryl-tRNA(Ser) seleniumtransferase
MASTRETDLRQSLPSVDQVLQHAQAQPLLVAHGRPLVIRELRLLLEEARAQAVQGRRDVVEESVRDLLVNLETRLARAQAPSLRRVVNATGVVVHTNLGRAPLPPAAAARVAQIAASYSNLELDLATGERGDREAHAEERLRALLGVEATAVVNNCAAAVLLAVNTLAEGKDVVVSRGELVEIGGSFRIPDILKKGGARLVEVGTTNRTRLSDYAAALGPGTGMILRVHPSNFRIVGFTAAPRVEELARLSTEAGVPLMVDQGSGLLGLEEGFLEGEETALAVLAAGADVVAMSGDKLLGGPQAGLVAGRRVLVEAMRRNPLYRALRVDKMTLAALDAVLAEHEAERAFRTVPVLRMLALTREEIHARAVAFARSLEDPAGSPLCAEVVPGGSAVGGGAAPTVELETALVALTHSSLSALRLAERLRGGRPPVVARIAEDQVLLDLRTVSPESEAELREAVLHAARSEAGPIGPRDGP